MADHDRQHELEAKIEQERFDAHREIHNQERRALLLQAAGELEGRYIIIALATLTLALIAIAISIAGLALR